MRPMGNVIATLRQGEFRLARSRHGFTLVELLIAMAIAGMLLAAVAPSASAFLAAAELRGSSETLVRALSVARSEAIKRGTRVDVCPTTDRMHCAASVTWDKGWLMFVNGAKSTQPLADSA